MKWQSTNVDGRLHSRDAKITDMLPPLRYVFWGVVNKLSQFSNNHEKGSYICINELSLGTIKKNKKGGVYIYIYIYIYIYNKYMKVILSILWVFFKLCYLLKILLFREKYIYKALWTKN
jgi:hypothetical protein